MIDSVNDRILWSVFAGTRARVCRNKIMAGGGMLDKGFHVSCRAANTVATTQSGGGGRLVGPHGRGERDRAVPGFGVTCGPEDLWAPWSPWRFRSVLGYDRSGGFRYRWALLTAVTLCP